MGKKSLGHKANSAHFGQVIESKDGFDIIKCEKCGFKHIIPLPKQKDLDKLYEEQFYSEEKPDYFKYVEEDLEWWNETYKSYYKMFEKYILNKHRRLLEIGSGPGYFLKCGKELGWDVLGVEPSKQAYKYSTKLGVSVINQFFSEESVGNNNKFDVVFMMNVLEHLPNPISLIKTAKNLLDKNGIICIISPNDYNPFQNILRKNLDYEPWWVVPKHHINYFNFHSIKDLLERLGFEIVETTGTFPMEFFLLCGDNYVGNNELGRKCHFKRKIFEKNMYKFGNTQLNTIYKALADNGIGREFVVIGRIKNNI